MKNYIICLLIIVGGIFTTGCGGASKDPDDPAPNVILAVEAAPIKTGTVDETVSAIGRTAVADKQTIVSPFAGTIVSVSVQPGTTVSRGEEVAVIRTRDSEASITGAKRLLADAKTEAQKETAQRALEVAQANQQLVPIIAQQRGTVADKLVSAGQAVAEGAEILQLVDLSTLDFIAEVRLADIGPIKIGLTCRIEFPSLPDRKFSGTVAAIEPQSDISSQTVPVRISFARTSEEIERNLRTGMRGIAEIITGVRKDVLLIPQAAVIRDDITGSYHIFTISPDSLAISVPVSTGVRIDSLVEVSSPGLKAGMCVIVDGSYESGDSMRVTVIGVP